LPLADNDQLSPLTTFDNVQFAANFDKVFHLGADFAVREFAAEVFVNQFAQSVLRECRAGNCPQRMTEELA
jgi:hypothetical protein